MPRRIPYSLVLDWDTTIAAAGSAVAKTDVDNDGDFVVERIAFTSWIPSASTAIAGTPAALEASPTIGNNTWMTTAHFRFEGRITDGVWQNAPVRVSNLIRPNGDGYDLTQRRIPRGQTVSGTLYNDSAQSIRGQMVFHGYKEVQD